MDNSGFRLWLDEVSKKAKARGGIAWTKTMLRNAKLEANRQTHDKTPIIHDRKRGEIVNPITGEISTGCLSIGAFAKALNITTHRLSQTMKHLGMVVYILDYRNVPMVRDAAFQKPRYFHTPDASQSAVKNNLVVPIKVRRKGGFGRFLLVTPLGQKFLRKAVTCGPSQEKAVDTRRKIVASLRCEGLTIREIIERTSFSRRSVLRHMKMIKHLEAGMPLF
ncbi:hypothetical protein [Brucella sp.]|uniref:hypothetical protein n=1 Tax=Brucella sp. TaxID=52132 RepID=UPI0028A6D06E|nr:hypothetical protein [Brucella sp.]